MTAIVGIVHEGKTWIGADSRVTHNDTHGSSLTPKLWRGGGYLIGAAGNSAWFAVLRRVQWPSVAAQAYMLSRFASDLSAAATGLGLELPAKEDEALDGAALIGGAGKLFYADSEFGLDEHDEFAIGGGGQCCRAVLNAFTSGRPRSRILRALHATTSVRTDVGPPFLVEHV